MYWEILAETSLHSEVCKVRVTIISANNLYFLNSQNPRQITLNSGHNKDGKNMLYSIGPCLMFGWKLYSVSKDIDTQLHT